MTVETFLANFGHLADAPNGVRKLRELILQLAVQGKLVPQNPKDESASDLFSALVSLKKSLIAEGRIRSEKVLPAVKVAEIAYSVPESWKLVRLVDVCECITQGPNPKYDGVEDDEFRVLKTKDFYDHIIYYDRTDKISGHLFAEFEKHRLKTGDIVFGLVGRGSTGKCNVFIERPGVKFIYTRATGLIRLLDKNLVLPEYVKGFFSSAVGKRISEEFEDGSTGQIVIKTSLLKTIPFPLPPLAEQRRIVAKVDQLMALCDELQARQQKQQEGRVRLNNAALDALLTTDDPADFAAHWQRISANFDLLYDHPDTIAKLRAAILQLAVQGKLVPQDPTDEPAEVLLEKIKAEKARLVKAGKLKKQRPLPAIDNSSTPFQLPKGWTWARFPEVGDFGRGKSKHRPRNDPSLYSGGTYPMVQTGDVARANCEIKTYTAQYNDVGLSQSKLWPKGTMCITIAANIADSAILGFDACFPDSVVGLVVSEKIGDVQYFEYFMRTAKAHLMDFAPSTAQKNINLEILESVYVPLPPLAEMERIVAKVDQLIALCDALEAKLNQARKKSGKLMEASVRQLLVA